MTITRTSFTGATSVDFGLTPAGYFLLNSDTQITVTSPACVPGAVDVTVVTPGGVSAVTTADRFTYSTSPQVAGIAPAAGPLSGGTSVLIVGAGFTGVTQVDFGTLAARYIVELGHGNHGDESAGFGSTVDVTVTGLSGTSAISLADQFDYLPVPSVTGVSATIGRLAGGFP